MNCFSFLNYSARTCLSFTFSRFTVNKPTCTFRLFSSFLTRNRNLVQKKQKTKKKKENRIATMHGAHTIASPWLKGDGRVALEVHDV